MSYTLPVYPLSAGETINIDPSRVANADGNPPEGVVLINGSGFFLTVQGPYGQVVIPPGINDLIPVAYGNDAITVQVGSTNLNSGITSPTLTGTVYVTQDQLPTGYPQPNPAYQLAPVNTLMLQDQLIANSPITLTQGGAVSRNFTIPQGIMSIAIVMEATGVGTLPFTVEGQSGSGGNPLGPAIDTDSFVVNSGGSARYYLTLDVLSASTTAVVFSCGSTSINPSFNMWVVGYPFPAAMVRNLNLWNQKAQYCELVSVDSSNLFTQLGTLTNPLVVQQQSGLSAASGGVDGVGNCSPGAGATVAILPAPTAGNVWWVKSFTIHATGAPASTAIVSLQRATSGGISWAKAFKSTDTVTAQSDAQWTTSEGLNVVNGLSISVAAEIIARQVVAGSV